MSAYRNQPGIGIFAVCAGLFCMATMEAVAKWLGSYYPVIQLIFVRNIFSLPAIILLALSGGGLRLLLSGNMWIHFLRGMLALIATICFFLALRFMPLASAWTIAFSGPLITTALTPVLLGERVGVWRWVGTFIGFVGVLVVLRPGTAAFQWAMLLPLGTAASDALLLVLARRYSVSEEFAPMVASTIIVPLVVTGAAMPFVWIEPSPVHWPAFFTLGVLGGAGLTFLTLGYRLAEAPVVAPFDYTAMIWSLLWGWVIWSDWPDPMTWVGGAIVVASGLFILHRETVRRPRASATPETEFTPVEG